MLRTYLDKARQQGKIDDMTYSQRLKEVEKNYVKRGFDEIYEGRSQCGGPVIFASSEDRKMPYRGAKDAALLNPKNVVSEIENAGVIVSDKLSECLSGYVESTTTRDIKKIRSQSITLKVPEGGVSALYANRAVYIVRIIYDDNNVLKEITLFLNHFDPVWYYMPKGKRIPMSVTVMKWLHKNFDYAE